MGERDQVYLQILSFGLLCLREAAIVGNLKQVAVEADHLHNLPSLIGESNVLRHAHYLDHERMLYPERVDRSVPRVDFTIHRYTELWQELQELTPPV